MEARGSQRKPPPGHRRSKRLPLHVPVFVYGRTANNRPFSDLTRMISINAHGGLLALAAPVEPDQTILLVNNSTQKSRACRVIYIGPEGSGKREIGVEFLRPTPNFWKIHFPPDNLQLAARRAVAPRDSSSPRTSPRLPPTSL